MLQRPKRKRVESAYSSYECSKVTYFNPYQNIEPGSYTTDPYNHTHPTCTLPTATDPVDYISDDIVDYIEGILASHYGFTRNLPSSPVYGYVGRMYPQPLTQDQLATLLRLIGLSPALLDHLVPVASALLEDAQHFLDGYIRDMVPDASHWDIAPHQYGLWKCSNSRLSHFCTIPHRRHRPLYCFYLAGYDYLLGMTSAADALTVCRWGQLDVVKLIAKLVKCGIRFYTLIRPGDRRPSPSPHCHQPSDPSSETVPIRPPDYTFNIHDYRRYIQSRDSLFKGPRRRAAAMRGGIIWRIAREYSELPVTAVLLGPSLTGPSDLVVEHTCTSEKFADDDLTYLEVQTICGAFKCQTGRDGEYILKYYWPPAEVFEAHDCGENYGRWNHIREAHFQKRLKELEEGSAQPLTKAEWRKEMQGTLEMRRLKEHVEQTSAQFLENIAPLCGITAF